MAVKEKSIVTDCTCRSCSACNSIEPLYHILFEKVPWNTGNDAFFNHQAQVVDFVHLNGTSPNGRTNLKIVLYKKNSN